MNFRRKSTVGWSIGNILLDLLGGILNFGQMGVQSIDQGVLHVSYRKCSKRFLVVVFIFLIKLNIVQIHW